MLMKIPFFNFIFLRQTLANKITSFSESTEVITEILTPFFKKIVTTTLTAWISGRYHAAAAYG